MNVRVYEPIDYCAKCGGNCCKHMGCHYSPRDFEDLSFDALKQEIEKGRISIDWWEGKTSHVSIISELDT